MLLREAMKGILPEKVRQRDDKTEFLETIMDQLDVLDLEILFEKALIVDFGIISEQKLCDCLTRYRDYHLSHVIELWTLTNLEIWLQREFENWP